MVRFESAGSSFTTQNGKLGACAFDSQSVSAHSAHSARSAVSLWGEREADDQV